MTLDDKFKREFNETFKRAFVDGKSRYIAIDPSLMNGGMKDAVIYGFTKKLLHQVGPCEKEKLLGGEFKINLYQLTERGKQYFKIQ